MTVRAEYTLHHSDQGGFLGASIREEESRNLLSVLSALARLDIDPWGEAARLSSLPRQDAASVLARTLSRLPGPHRTSSERKVIADRLVGLLPKPGVAADSDGEGRDRPTTGEAETRLIWLALVAAVFMMLNSGLIL